MECVSTADDSQNIQDAGSAEQWKALVIGSVNEILSDISKVTNSALHGHVQTALDFILNAANRYPEIFIPPLPTSWTDQPNNSDEEWEKLLRSQPYELTCWIISHLLRILAVPGFNEVQAKAQSVVRAFLCTANSINHFCFRQLSMEILSALEDLSEYFVNFFGEAGCNYSATLVRFGASRPSGNNLDSGFSSFKYSTIEIKEPELCQQLQIALTKVLSELTIPLSFYESLTNRLWKVVNCQLENADADLKTASLELSGRLLQLGIPESHLLERHCDCLVSLANLLCSGFTDCEGDFVDLEVALSKSLTDVVAVVDDRVVLPLDRLLILQLLHSQLLNALIIHGTKSLRTVQLRSATYRCLMHSVRHLPIDVVSFEALSDVYKEGLCRKVMAELGDGDDSKYLVSVLRQIVFLEFSDLYPDQTKSGDDRYAIGTAPTDAIDPQMEKKGDGPPTSVIQSSEVLVGSQVEKMDSSEVGEVSVLADKSTVVALLNEYLKEFTESIVNDELSGEDVLRNLRSQCYLLETLAGCLVIHRHVTQNYNSRLAGRSQEVVHLLRSEQMSQILSSWSACFVRSLPDDTFDEVLSAYGVIVKAIGALFYAQDLAGTRIEVLHTLVGILSLPWLSGEMSWLDLKLRDKQQLLKISERLGDKIDDQIVKECLQILSLVTKHCAPRWRILLFQKAFGDTREVVKAAAISNLPYLLNQIGTSAYYILPEMAHGFLLDGSDLVLQALAQSLGPIVCVVSGKTTLVRSPLVDEERLSYQTILLKCGCCSRVSEDVDKEVRLAKALDVPLPKSDISVFQQFTKLLSSNCSAVKLNLIGCLDKLFGHLLGWHNEALFMEWLNAVLILLQDPDYEVRFAFSKVVKHLIVQSGDLSTKVNEVFVTRLNVLDKAMANGPPCAPLVETMLLTVGEIGKVAEADLLLKAITVLLNAVIFPVSLLLESIALQQLRLVSAKKNVSMKHLFLQFGHQICQAIADCLHDTKKRKPDWDPSEVLQKVADVFGFIDIQAFLKRTENLLLPHLVRKASPTTSMLLKSVSRLMDDPNHKNAIIRTISHIFCHVICSIEQQTELWKVLTYLETETDWSLSKLLMCGSNVESLLLVHLSSNHQQVLNGLKICLNAKGLIQGPRNSLCTDNQLAELLKPNLLGILVHFDKHLNDGTVPQSEKKKAYKSLVQLMQLMGRQNISRVRMRVMTTLKIGLKFKDGCFTELCCEAWSGFVHLLDMVALGPMLCQIVVSLLPLLQLLPSQVAAIFQYLIVDNREGLHDHLHELYFLPDMPELIHVNTVLKQYIEGQYSCKDLRTQIGHLLKGISHESLDVRQMALLRMKQLLRTNKDVLHDMVLGNETADPIISQIVAALMQGCRESDPAARNLFGECLGELGAIDPGRLELISDHPKEQASRIFTSVVEDDFAFELINELGKAFLRAEDRTAQDCVAFALQELIRIYDIKIEDSSGCAGKLWNKFSMEVQEILLPLTQSRYKLNVTLNWSGLQRPIYRSRKGSTFEQWLCTLASYLESRVTDEKCRRVFEVCRGVINQDRHIALYLLPYLALQILMEGSFDDQGMLLQELSSVLLDAKEDEVRHGSPSDLRHMSAQTVFSVLDYLTKWLRQHAMKRADKLPTPPDVRGVIDLKAFMAKVPNDVLALASYNCGAVTRAIMHHEHFMKSLEKSGCKQENLDFLLKLYLALDEPDGVAGIVAIQQTQPSLPQQILAFESVGQLSDASVCYDLAIQLDPTDITYRQGLLKNRLALGELSSALNLANGMITENSAWTSQLNMYRIEASWKLGQWGKMELYLKSEDCSRDWNIGLGRVLLAAKSKDEKSLHASLLRLRQEQMAPLSAASMEAGAYHRGYEYIVRLHMLKELEDGLKIALGLTSSVNQDSSYCRDSSSANLLPLDENAELATLIQRWQGRLEFTQSSYRTRSPILDLQRVILTLAKEERGFQTDHQIGNCWLQSARMARKCALSQTAHSLLLSAAEYKLQEFCIEKAKWLWNKGDFDQARSCLEKAVDQLYPDRSKYKTPSGVEIQPADRLTCAKALLQLSRYNEETASCESNTIMRQFKEVKEVNSEWEDGYFYTAKYYDKIMMSTIENDRPDKRGEFITQVVMHFGQSLCYGNQYIYQSMPRLLTLWLDFGAEVMLNDDKTDAIKQSMRASLSTMNKLMSNFCKRLSPYQFLISFPQLISRICHAQPDVFSQLKEMIANLLKEFPQQAMWMMMAVSKSSYQMRVKRCQEIFHRAKSLKPDLNKFLQDSTKLADRLLDLCNRQPEGNLLQLSISTNFKPLQRLLEDAEMSPILLPLQCQMLPILPSMPVAPSSHVPFSTNQVFIKGIEDTVEVLASLQKPKKITFRGSDGKPYIMLCKPRDDLRKDARLMEFTGIVNRCLKRDVDSRRRELHIRTFTVTPLNEECGLLEWVSNVQGLRPVLLKLYREKGLSMSGKELKVLQLPPNAPVEKKLQIYKTKLIPRHPAIFSEWFLRKFHDPTSWYNARLAYCRTTAVMSMVGYILGLGDRHGENILIDSTVGDCLHVDFNCLFNKGETFDFPEIVPFRLTHNMIDAMGPLGYEGIFRRSCEVTLRVMRDQKDPLMSVLKTFIYDPLVEWSKPARGRNNPTESGEIRNEKAQTHVNNIEDRLRGILKTKSKNLGLPLSVEGHVSHLIKESTDENNLCQMYVGWAAYM